MVGTLPDSTGLQFEYSQVISVHSPRGTPSYFREIVYSLLTFYYYYDLHFLMVEDNNQTCYHIHVVTYYSTFNNHVSTFNTTTILEYHKRSYRWTFWTENHNSWKWSVNPLSQGQYFTAVFKAEFRGIWVNYHMITCWFSRFWGEIPRFRGRITPLLSVQRFQKPFFNAFALPFCLMR